MPKSQETRIRPIHGRVVASDANKADRMSEETLETCFGVGYINMICTNSFVCVVLSDKKILREMRKRTKGDLCCRNIQQDKLLKIDFISCVAKK